MTQFNFLNDFKFDIDFIAVQNKERELCITQNLSITMFPENKTVVLITMYPSI